MKLRSKYRELFFSTLKLSACTFGGGFVIVPLMRRRFVEELGWIDEQEMLDLTAIAQSCPGAIAVNASVLVGYRVAGLSGALVCALGTVLPPLMIIGIISLFYRQFRDHALVAMAMQGILAGVAAVIVHVVWGMLCALGRQRRLIPWLILGAAFIGVRFLNVNIILIILLSGLAGALMGKEAAK